MIQDWSTVTLEALQGLWQGFLNFLPKLIGAIIIFVIGWFVAVWIGKLIAEILKRLKLDKIFEKTGWQETFEKAEFKMTMSEFIGAVVKWVLVIVFLLAAVRLLVGAPYVGFFNEFIAWLPNLVAAAAIFVIAAIIASLSEKFVKAVVGKMKVGYAELIGSIVKWAIWIFAILTILAQLRVAPEIIQIVITGFVALIVISCSLAFGLGGKDLARELLEGLRNKFKE